MGFLRLFAALALIARPLPGQTTQAPAEMVTRSQSATFRAGTNEVEVPVVVRDGKGRAVGSLRSADFRLFDKGKPQVVSRLTVIEAGKDVSTAAEAPGTPAPGSSAVPERFTVYLLDDSWGWSIRLRDAAIRHMLTRLGPADRAAIISTSGRYAIDFTDDSSRLVETLRRFQLPEFVPAHPHMSIEEISSLLQDLGRHSLDGLQEAIRRLSVIPGQRRIVLVSNGFLTHDFVNLDTGMTIRINLGDYQNEVLHRAIRARVTVNALSPAGLSPFFKLDGIAAQAQNALAYISYGTGGIFIKDNNDLDEALRQVASVPEHSYILTFSPQNLKYDGSYHELKVAVPGRKDADVQARAGYFAPRKLDDPIETAREELREALFSRDEIDELPADVHTGFTRLSPGKARVNLQIHLGLRTLHFRKGDGRNAAELTVVVGLFDRNGVYVNGKQTDVEFRLKEETFEQWMHNGVKIGCNLDAAPGSYLVRLVVRDSEGRAMAAHNAAVEIP